jgi:formamidopyrimidine-DNA glycosylase
VPELPEVEVVRRGLERWVSGRTVARVEVLHPRAIRRHPAGPADFADRLTGRRLGRACRRGKYLWLPVEETGAAESGTAESGAAESGTGHAGVAGHAGAGASGPGESAALLGHLGMSGQMLLRTPDAPDETHLRVRVAFTDGGPELRFVDQRTFGGLSVEETGPGAVPLVISHIARDPIDPTFDEDAFHAALRRRRTGLKRALLDQSLISGVGNIYADEALWRAGLHYERPTATMTRPRTAALVAAIRDVMAAALAAGGTSFDSLYVNVNGESGYFDRSLNAYGREDEPCRRCTTPIRRRPFMNRSSYFCPSCQRAPRGA